MLSASLPRLRTAATFLLAATVAACGVNHELPEEPNPELAVNEQEIIGGTLDTGDLAVVQLAAISNDPMGNRFEKPTMDINQGSAVSIAKAASDAGVKNYVFASSCSVYGIALGGPRKESDDLNPITAYAKSKIGAERELAELDTDMTITCLRFATACGMSDRLRLDLVLNDFVACALSQGEITVLSDGSPWRPLIDVADMARAIDWAVSRPADNGGRYLAMNAGADECNYQVRDLANAVADAVPGTKVSINLDAPADSRSLTSSARSSSSSAGERSTCSSAGSPTVSGSGSSPVGRRPTSSSRSSYSWPSITARAAVHTDHVLRQFAVRTRDLPTMSTLNSRREKPPG